MSGTFSQIYIQVVFAVKYRESLIQLNWENNLYKYITGIVLGKNQKMLAINGVSDHIHFLIGMKPNCNLSDLVREVKKSSSEFVKEQQFTTQRFAWQEGFGAFSYSQSNFSNVINYIHNQKEHHRKQTFKEEYTSLLKKFEIDYKDEYLFDWIDESGTSIVPNVLQ
jgi:putative transposase